MTDKKILDNIKKLREITGVGFSDCKLAITKSNGDIEKSIEYLRKKGIAKASKKMSRISSEGLVLATEREGKISIIEINSETDFVAKNKEFITFCKELSELNFTPIIEKSISSENPAQVRSPCRWRQADGVTQWTSATAMRSRASCSCGTLRSSTQWLSSWPTPKTRG